MTLNYIFEFEVGMIIIKDEKNCDSRFDVLDT